MNINAQNLAHQIFNEISPHGVTAVAMCMTRLRINLADYRQLNLAKLTAIDGVKDALVAEEQLQIVLGLGTVLEAYVSFKNLLDPEEHCTSTGGPATDEFDPRLCAKHIFQHTLGGKVTAAAICLTRLRLNIKDFAKVDLLALKSIDGVKEALIAEDQLQLVLGPGRVFDVYVAFKVLIQQEDPAAILADSKL